MDGVVDRDLYGLVERVTRIETIVDQQAKASAEFRVHTTTSIDAINGKLDVIGKQMTKVETGFSIAKWLSSYIPAGAIGAAITWVLAHWK